MHARIVAFDLEEVRSTAGGAALYADGNDVVTYALPTGTGLAYGRHDAP